MQIASIHHPASYRDPSGFIFEKGGIIYRQVNICFKEHFDHFIKSGLYAQLVEKKMLLPHEEVEENLTADSQYYKCLKPAQLSFISYPYEWCFEMLKDAALLTLQLAKESLNYGMMLKDSPAFNIQWHEGRLIFIDTLSFEKREDGKPWIAYRQFCEQFLAPLLLMHYSGNPLQELLLAYPEGIPIKTCASLLPAKSKFSLYTYLHAHLHSRLSGKKENPGKQHFFSEKKLENLLKSLEALINSLHLKENKSAWSGYYKEVENRKDYLQQKKQIVESWIDKSKARTAADLGANEGEFSTLLGQKNIQTLAADFDAFCINRLYKRIKSSQEKNVLPLVINLANPSPSIGVNNQERNSFIDRTNVDLALALALIHHLCVGRNIPFDMVAAFFKSVCSTLIIEFVPKEDEKVKFMLQQKKDIYDWYKEENFVNAFSEYFEVIDKQIISGTQRVLYLMKKI
ncbi:MAG TPA: hypothetical protein VIQ00_01235 [Chitinophagaceae bacterium]